MVYINCPITKLFVSVIFYNKVNFTTDQKSKTVHVRANDNYDDLPNVIGKNLSNNMVILMYHIYRIGLLIMG